MYLLYLDESGDPNGWQYQKNYVLAGVAIWEGQIWRLSCELDNLQDKYFHGISCPIAFHASDIRRGKGTHFENMKPELREEILKEVCNVVANSVFPSLVAFATTVDISAYESPLQVRRLTLEDVCARFNTFLMRQFKANKGSKGLLIIDRNREGEYRSLMADFKRDGVKSGYLGQIVDIPYFAGCSDTRMLQLADAVANAVFQYYEKGIAEYLDIILPKFDRREKDHPPDGLKHFTKNQPCPCPACNWRGKKASERDTDITLLFDEES
jgi:hypothetical protein